MRLTVKEHNTKPILIHGNGTGKEGDVYKELKSLQFQKRQTHQIITLHLSVGRVGISRVEKLSLRSPVNNMVSKY